MGGSLVDAAFCGQMCMYGACDRSSWCRAESNIDIRDKEIVHR